MSTPTLQKLPSVVHWGNSRYAVMLDGKEIGTLSKDHDSFNVKHKWKAWRKGRASDDTDWLGEFNSWHEAATAVHEAHLTKQQTSTKE